VASYTYTGTDEVYLADVPLVVRPGDVVDLEDGFTHPDFTPGATVAPPAVVVPDPVPADEPADPTPAAE